MKSLSILKGLVVLLIASQLLPGFSFGADPLSTINALVNLMAPKDSYVGGKFATGTSTGEDCSVQILNDSDGYTMNIVRARDNWLAATLTVYPVEDSQWKSFFADGSPTNNAVSVVVTEKASDEVAQDSRSTLSITQTGNTFTVSQNDDDNGGTVTCAGVQ